MIKMTGLLMTGPALLLTGALHAAVIDDMDNTDRFSEVFGAASVVDNADGTVTLTKTNGFEQDSGAVWTGEAGGKIALTDSQVTITPYAPADNDFINVTAIYFNAADAFVGQSLVLTDTNQETPIVFDAAAGAPDGAVSYVLQVRVLPFAEADASFTFDQIAAAPIPEPASLMLTGIGALCVLYRSGR